MLMEIIKEFAAAAVEGLMSEAKTAAAPALEGPLGSHTWPELAQEVRAQGGTTYPKGRRATKSELIVFLGGSPEEGMMRGGREAGEPNTSAMRNQRS